MPARAEQPSAARTAGVKFVKSAEIKLPKDRRGVRGAEARHLTAIEIRDEVVRILHAAPYGWTRPQLTGAIGRDHKVVDRIVDPEGTSRPQAVTPGAPTPSMAVEDPESLRSQ